MQKIRIPQTPPQLHTLLAKLKPANRLVEILSQIKNGKTRDSYLHWDELRHKTPPPGISHQEWWLGVKTSRLSLLKPIGLKDKVGIPFQFGLPEIVMKKLHEMDLGAGGMIDLPGPTANLPRARDRYLVRSLIEESIASSQLEGAVTTREVAKEMIRSGRAPRDRSEPMILNNYFTLERIRKLKSSPLTRDLVFEIHKLVTEKTLNDPTAAGRFRRPGEVIEVGDDYGTVYHSPPPAEELSERMKKMCAFANNGESHDVYIHPVVRAILLHFWLAYDHPFVDGNGRTARALFYWAMLRNRYWLFEFISISARLRKSPIQYGKSFLYTETDDNDLSYFLIAQIQVIRQAIRDLHAYIERKTAENQKVESEIRASNLFNHRQIEIIRHALKHPGQCYTFASHAMSHKVAPLTARTDLMKLSQRGLLKKRKNGRRIVFFAPADLSSRLKKLSEKMAK